MTPRAWAFGLVVSAVLATSCAGKLTVPYDADVPEGGTVIYHADHSRIGFNGDPVRIVQLGDQCITEIWGGPWTFVSSSPCSAALSDPKP